MSEASDKAFQEYKNSVNVTAEWVALLDNPSCDVFKKMFEAGYIFGQRDAKDTLRDMLHGKKVER